MQLKFQLLILQNIMKLHNWHNNMLPQYLILLAIFGWGIGSLFIKGANDNMHPIMVSTFMTMTYALLTPLSFLFIKFNHSVNFSGIAYAIVGALFMCTGSMGYFFALKSGAAGQITIMTSLYPALTLFISCMFLGEQMSLKKAIGIGFALISFLILKGK